MSTATVSSGVSTPNLIASVLNPSFKGIPDARALAKYFMNALITIRRNDLPIRIYVSKEVSQKISNILSAMGITFRTTPVNKMTPPYIYLFTEGNYIVIKTVDPAGKEVATYRAPFTKFVEAFEEFFFSKKEKKKNGKKTKEIVEEIVVPSLDLEKFMEKYGHILDDLENQF